jgi:DNA anti-recombination protein RmuC
LVLPSQLDSSKPGIRAQCFPGRFFEGRLLEAVFAEKNERLKEKDERLKERDERLKQIFKEKDERLKEILKGKDERFKEKDNVLKSLELKILDVETK